MNYARRQPPVVEPGTVFKGVNFSQEKAGTVLVNLVGVPVTFRRCNLVNVAIDKEWTVKDSNTTQGDLPAPLTEREQKLQERVNERNKRDEAVAEITRIDAWLASNP